MLHLLSAMYTKRPMRRRWACTPSLPARLITVVLLLTAGSPDSSSAQGAPDTTESTLSQIDRIHDSMALSVNEAAQWFDSFFEDERYISEEASSRIRLRPSILLEEGEAADTKFSLGVRINVPRFNKKLKLVISDVNADNNTSFDSRQFTDPQSDETNVGLQYTLKDKNRLNTHLAAGIKTGGNHGIDFFIGPRVRKTWRLDLWQLRLTERLRWYTDIGWESRSRADIERVVNTDWLFRTTFDARVRKNDYHEDGLRYSIAPSLVQKLPHHAAIEYQWSTSLVTRPNHRVEETGLRLRFRKRVWRKWLFYEINPQLVFRNNDDFRATPGIEFRLEASFGGLDKN